VKVEVELSEEAARKLEDIQKKFGFKTIDEAASYVLNRYIKIVLPVEETLYRLFVEKVLTDLASYFAPHDELAEALYLLYKKEAEM
jgi:hypothetical protein